MKIRFAAQHLDGRLEQHNGGRAIHVIIAVDGWLQAHNRHLHPRYRRGHPLHPVGIEQCSMRG